MKSPNVADAARNNAEWCDLMCRAHGTGGTFGAHAWSTPVRSPQYYPDAITLDRDADADDLLTRVDASTGCSVKDSFATLDLAQAGWRVLFEAEWFCRAPASAASAPASPTWARVTATRELAEWEAAWADPAGASGLFRAEILDDPRVCVLAGRDGGEIVEGAVLSRAANVVGLSNVFSRRGDIDAAWNGAVRGACIHFPNEALVGYEASVDLAAPLVNGFVALGPLRVWGND